MARQSLALPKGVAAPRAAEFERALRVQARGAARAGRCVLLRQAEQRHAARADAFFDTPEAKKEEAAPGSFRTRSSGHPNTRKRGTNPRHSQGESLSEELRGRVHRHGCWADL